MSGTGERPVPPASPADPDTAAAADPERGTDPVAADPDAPARPLDDATRWRLAAVATALAVAFALLSALVGDRPPGEWELATVRRATGLTDVVGYPARGVMQLGTLGAVVALGLVMAWLTGKRLPPVAVIVAALVALGIANRMKLVVERDRPAGVRIREVQDSFGYPSSHAAVAVAAAVVLTALVPRRWRWVPGALALVVALARMHVGVHFPLDLVGGALVGGAVGLLTLAVLDPAHR
jgi:membrane-associated phospholipid phosphatase